MRRRRSRQRAFAETRSRRRAEEHEHDEAIRTTGGESEGESEIHLMGNFCLPSHRLPRARSIALGCRDIPRHLVVRADRVAFPVFGTEDCGGGWDLAAEEMPAGQRLSLVPVGGPPDRIDSRHFGPIRRARRSSTAAA